MMRLWKRSLAVTAFVVGACGFEPASVEALCDKCRECLDENADFNEGFCTPFFDEGRFDVDACESSADPDAVEGVVRDNEIEDMSCFEFDRAI